MTFDKPTGSGENNKFWRRSRFGKLSLTVSMVLCIAGAWGGIKIAAGGSVSEATTLILKAQASWFVYLLIIGISGRYEALRVEAHEFIFESNFSRFNEPSLIFLPLLQGILWGVLVWFLLLFLKGFIWLIELI
jgi:hypothetical protein